MRNRLAGLMGTAGALLLAACGDAAPGTGPECAVAPLPSSVPPAVPPSSPFDAAFERAGAEHGVPAGLLRAVGYAETRWQMVRGEEEFPGLPPAFGVMALRGERLRRGAGLAGVSVEAARSEPEANVRAAAALLRVYADQAGIDRGDLDAWGPVVARFSGIATAEGRAGFVRDAVLPALHGRGVRAAASASRSAGVDPCGPGTPPQPPAGPADQPGAVWRPSPNFNDRAPGEPGRVQMVIVHTCEGSYAGCWSWLTSPQSGVSAHYVVNEGGTEVSQLVAEAKRAWHIGATYDCSLNAGHGCSGLSGVQSNHFTIGVEHGGFASQTRWPEAQIDASARLVCAVTRRWNVPRDRFHVLGHAQLQPYNRTDPGASWPWADYYARIAAHCGG